jgi:hypothetical protein
MCPEMEKNILLNTSPAQRHFNTSIGQLNITDSEMSTGNR